MKKIKQKYQSYIFTIIGSFILAAGINIFTLPNKISSGGISTLGTILLYKFGVKMSLTNMIFNGILFFFGFKSLGKQAVMQTLFGIVMFSVFLELTSSFPAYTENRAIAAISGGAAAGIGIGLVIRRGASTGGSDFAGLILKKFFPHISLAVLIMLVDCVIVIISGFVFKSFTVTFYSLSALLVSSTIADKISIFGDKAKILGIFSEKNKEISSCIIKTYGRGATGIHCTGMYSEKQALMLLCAAKPRELPMYLKLIKQIDKNAFVIIGEVHEVLGEGFNEM